MQRTVMSHRGPSQIIIARQRKRLVLWDDAGMTNDDPPRAAAAPAAAAPPRTEIAMQGARIAGSFRGAFAGTKLGEHTPDMTEPEETTGHGALALLHVTLRSSSGLGLLIGKVDCVKRSAELRPYALVAGEHEERFKKGPDFDVEAYQAFLDKARTLLGDLGLQVSVAGAPAGARKGEPTAAPLVSGKVMLALLFGLVIGGLVVWLALR
jgi:hypothetical protein